MNILITGGTGFLGSHIVKKLLLNNNIIVLSRGIKNEYSSILSTEEIKAINFILCDLRNIEYLKTIISSDINLIIHCAAKINICSNGRYSDNLIEDNLISTINLIEAMIEKGIKNIIFCSSMTVYGVENNIPISENGILKPINFYGFTKKWAEEAIINYSQKKLLNAVILRLPGLYGYPRKSGYIYNLIKKIFENHDINIKTKGLKFWETVNVEDTAEIIKRIIKIWKWETNFEILNCSYGEEIDFIETAFKIKKIINSKSIINIEKPIDYIKFYLDNLKLKELIDIEYTFEKSLKNFIEKYEGWLRS